MEPKLTTTGEIDSEVLATRAVARMILESITDWMQDRLTDDELRARLKYNSALLNEKWNKGR